MRLGISGSNVGIVVGGTTVAAANLADAVNGTGLFANDLSLQYDPVSDSWARSRQVVSAVGLASAARTVTTSTPTLTNYSSRGVLLQIDVTANPGGAQTVQLRVDVSWDGGTTFVPYAAGVATALAGNPGDRQLVVYAGAATAPTNGEQVQLPIPRFWRATVVHSGAGSWTYALRVDTIP